MKGASLYEGFISKLRSNKRLEILVYSLLALAALLIFALTGGFAKKEKASSAQVKTESFFGSSAEGVQGDEALERRLEALLSSIEGAGAVRVMLTSGEAPSAGAGTGSGAASNDLTSVKGVVVVAAGADDIRVKTELILAVTTVLGVEASRVSVFKLNAYPNDF